MGLSDRQWWLKDRRISEREQEQLSVNEMLDDLRLKRNYDPRKSRLYYEICYNYDYVNVSLFQNESLQILKEFEQLENKLEKQKKMNPILKERIEQMKAELMERAVLWDRVRREVYADFKRRDALKDEAGEEIEQQFTQEDFERLMFLEMKYDHSEGVENLKQVAEMMSIEKKSLQERVHEVEKHKAEKEEIKSRVLAERETETQSLQRGHL